MWRAIKSLLSIIVVSSLMGCATVGRIEQALFKNSALHNINPAPESMSPPKVVDDETKMIDPTYVSSQADYHYSLGEALSLDGNSERAIEEFKLTLIYDPQSVMVRLRLAAEYIKAGMITESIEQAEFAVGVNPESLEGRLMLGGLYSSLRMYTRAEDQYRILREYYPENQDVPIYLGALFAEQGRLDEAVEHFDALAKDKEFKKPELAYYYKGRILAEKGGTENIKRAQKAFMSALSLQPESEDSVLALSKTYEAMGQGDKGLKLLESFQDKFGPKRKVTERLGQVFLEQEEYSKALIQLEYAEGFDSDNLNTKVKIALVLIEQKQFPRAIKKLEEILTIAPESDKIRFYLGAVFEETKDYVRAIDEFARIPSGSSYYPEAVIHVAYLHQKQGDRGNSIKAIEKALAQRDDVPQFYAFYASLLDEEKQFDQAIKMLTKAIEKFPDNTQLRFFLGSMHDRKGQKDKTIAEMKRVLELDENHVRALNYLAYTYAESNLNLEEAESLARRALELKPDDGYILDTVGWIMFKRGEVEGAIQYLEAAYRHQHTEAIIAEHLGDAYYRFQLVEKAKKMYLRALEIEEDDKKIKQLKVKIVGIERQEKPKDKEDKLRTPASLPSQQSSHQLDE